MIIQLDLPFPVSTNRLWRRAGVNVHLSEEYQRWKRESDALLLAARFKVPAQPIENFTIDIVMSQKNRRGDGDNYIKCVLDYLQRIEVVRDDKLCEAGKWRWGDAPSGCRVIVESPSLWLRPVDEMPMAR